MLPKKLDWEEYGKHHKPIGPCSNGTTRRQALFELGAPDNARGHLRPACLTSEP
jgi:hypothetical protein